MYFQTTQWLYLLIFIPLFIYFLYFALKKKRETLSLFTGGLASDENEFQIRGFRISSFLILLTLVFLIFALVRPSWDKQTRIIEKKGHDVVFLIDVSRSMLADDLIPNRLERAKLAVIDAVNSFDGDRVALIAFAGTAVVKTPLTTDYSFFINAINRLKVDSVSKGGSLIGDAIRYTLKNVIQNSETAKKDMIIITDGEDQESFPVNAAEEADSMGVRIIAIGLGDEKEGRRIPVETERGTEFLSYEGKEVWTRLDADTLRKIAGSTEGGQYLNVSTGTFDLAEIYSALSRGMEKTDFGEESVDLYEERFQLFLFMSLIFLIISFFQPFRGWSHLISERDKKTIGRIFKK
ncbi:vWA domain-containing protein [Spirochaeta isovalerica]|uniref:Ca-activated chloride channel family protein n=1 Tax=Spirochaeta isovalerica TaxID=150 RepID=A0A841R7N9_9SPIO|nr:VWA domain-containing protein [Spirochaeta isovalerica]MBB6478758.1 Ca-activated chloride channel family protein [Spirochaeta isovalerica]